MERKVLLQYLFPKEIEELEEYLNKEKITEENKERIYSVIIKILKRLQFYDIEKILENIDLVIRIKTKQETFK